MCFKTNSCEFIHTGSNDQGYFSQTIIKQLNTNKKAVELKLINIEARHTEQKLYP